MSVTVLIVACYAGASLLLLGIAAKVIEWRNRRRWNRRRKRRGGNIVELRRHRLGRFGETPAGQPPTSVRGRRW